MRSLNEYIEIIKKCSDVLRSYFGVTSLRIFGSVARNEELKKYLEEKFGCPVDVIRLHKNMNEFLKRQIEKDGILVSL